MDEHAVRATRKHYDRHACKDVNENLRNRQNSPALPLRNFHNKIKACLIKRFCYKADQVLDFCCGRGGDIRKWDQAQVGYVRGIDLSPGEIEEAWLRYDSYKRRNARSSLRAEFQFCDVLGVNRYNDDRAPYDVVSCFFALHYFLASEEAIHNLLMNASGNLKKGGYFIGTCPDGKRVISALMNSKQRHRVDTSMLKLIPRWEGDCACFGSAYTCVITDTVTEGHEESSGSYEYLVFRNVVEGIAAKFGLKLVKTYEDAEELCDCFDEADEHEGFKHFKPYFPQSDDSLHLASSLNMAFVFQKVAEFEEKEDGSYESLGFEDCQTSMPPKPSTSVPSRGDWKRGQKRQFEAGNEGRKRKDSDSRGVKHKSRDQKEKNNKEGPKAKTGSADGDEQKSGSRQERSDGEGSKPAEVLSAAINGEAAAQASSQWIPD